MKIEYIETGLHLITGSCTAIDADFENESEDSDFGYYTILDDNSTGYCLTLNLPIGDASPPNKYPKVNDRVIIWAEGIQRVHHPQHRYVGYAEICQVASEDEITKAREQFERESTISTIQILPQSIDLENILRLYDALDEPSKATFVNECIHHYDQAIVRKYICEGFLIPQNHLGAEFYTYVSWNLQKAIEATSNDGYIPVNVRFIANHAILEKEMVEQIIGIKL